jgi:hypothetical protein
MLFSRIAKSMTPADISAAQKLVRECVKKNYCRLYVWAQVFIGPLLQGFFNDIRPPRLPRDGFTIAEESAGRTVVRLQRKPHRGVGAVRYRPTFRTAHVGGDQTRRHSIGALPT